MVDENWDENRGTVRAGRGPENLTALRRFDIGIREARSRDTVAAAIQRLARNIRRVFDYLRMTRDSQRPPTTRPAPDRPSALERIWPVSNA